MATICSEPEPAVYFRIGAIASKVIPLTGSRSPEELVGRPISAGAPD